MNKRAGGFYPILVAVILLGAVFARLGDPFLIQAVRLIAFDSYQRISPQTYDPDLPVRIVDIDEESLARIGQWPWSRLVLADLLINLTNQGAASVAFDILFSEPDRTSPEQAVSVLPPEQAALVRPIIAGLKSHDEIFGEVIGQAPSVLAFVLSQREGNPFEPKAGFAIAGDDPAVFIPTFPGITSNLVALDEAAAGLGSINWVPDRDQVVRRVQLMFRANDQYLPTLVGESLRVAQGASTYILKSSNASGETAFGRETGLNHIRIGALEIPTDADGGIWLQFRPSNRDAYIPAWKVLNGENDPNDIAGRMILVVTSAPGLMDLRATPLDAAIPGVEVHAQAMEHILTGRTVIRPDYSLMLELFVTLVLGAGLAAIMPRISAARSAIIGAAVVATLLIGGWAIYAYAGTLLDASFPAITMFVLVMASTLYIYRRVEQQRGEVRRAFSYYVAPTLVDEIIADPTKLELGGVVRPLSILFCDVRNFTSISERMTAQELTSFINNLLTPLSDIILNTRGTIDKYMGDAIMAFWNAPLDDEKHAENACAAAAKMIACMEELNDKWRAEAEKAGREYNTVAIGIGINSGDCCVGNLGSVQRFDYSAIGDNVNIASRFEGLSKVYGVPIVLGESTVAQIDDISAIELDIMRVKGRAQPTRIYTTFSAMKADQSQIDQLTPVHADMLTVYRGQEWDMAEAAIDRCQAVGIAGLDALYNTYRERIGEYRENPPPADWDGAFTATSK
jgi:adenylate cyclase